MSGNVKNETESEAPGEAAWINTFKHNHVYEVQNGWKRWKSSSSKNFSEGADGVPFQIYVECASDCEVDIPDGAIMLFVSTLAITFLSLL